MQLESLSCNNCGAPLDVPRDANYVTCNHCSCQLAVHRTSTVSYTEKLQQLDDRTNTMARHLAEVRYRQALDAADRQWELERQRYLVGEDKREPTTEGSLFVGVIGVSCMLAIGVVASLAGSAMGALALIAAVVGLFIAVSNFGKARDFADAKKRYELQRSKIKLEDFLPGGRCEQSTSAGSSDDPALERFIEESEDVRAR